MELEHNKRISKTAYLCTVQLLLTIHVRNQLRTSRDRPKSAPYLRLKNSKRTSICQSIGELGTLLWKKNLEKKSHNAEKNWKGGPFGIFQHPFCRKTATKIEGGPFEKKNFRKKSHNAEKTERGNLWSRPVCYVTRENRKTLFGSVRSAKWCNLEQ